MIATGRIPNTDLALEETGVELGERGEIKVNEHLQTSVEHIYAVGDVKGGLQFTYISLDDFRILKSTLYGDQSRTTLNRGTIPYTVFIDPPFSRVGLTAKKLNLKAIIIMKIHYLSLKFRDIRLIMTLAAFSKLLSIKILI